LAEPAVNIGNPTSVHPSKGRTAGIVGILTVLVAVVGYLREAVLASRFGVSASMDAYFAAIFIPNILYLILIVGTLSPIFIPLLLRDEAAGEDRAKVSRTFSVIATFSILVMVVTVLVAVATARWWLHLLFPGFAPATFAMALRLVYVIFPALPFLAVAGILTAVLNGFHRFWLAALAPAISSMSVIAAALFVRGDSAIYAIGGATAIGFLLQALILAPAIASLHIRYRPVLDLRHPAIRKLLKLGVPLFLFLAVGNASDVLERILASGISTGTVAILTYAFRLFAVPANFLAAPLATVAYPGFAREAARDSRGELGNQISRIFRLVIFLFLPATIWVSLNALPLTRLLYERGQFHFADSVVTARVLAIYSLAILPNAIVMILLRCFLAIEDTVTPLMAELVRLGTFAVTAVWFTRHFGIQGLASARTLSFFVTTAILILVLAGRKALLKFHAGLLGFLARTSLATIGMTAVSWTGLHFFRAPFDSGNTVVRLGIVCVLLAASAGAYLALARLMRLKEADHLWATVLSLIPGNWDRT
jgi:putative peptidoglycan lipid II flippase